MSDTDSDTSEKDKVEQAEQELGKVKDDLDEAEDELVKAEDDLKEARASGQPGEETITITRVGLWQGIAGVLAVLFVASILMQGVGVNLGGGTGAAGAPNQQAGSGGSGSGSGGTGGSGSGGAGSGGSAGASPASVGDDPVLGQEDAPVTLVKFTDFGCPFCKRWHDNTKPQLEQNYVESGDLKIVYKDAPIPQLHPGASQAHAAANCVLEQSDTSTYYEYTDQLYSNQNQFASNTGQSATDFLVSAASDIGVDIQSCLENNDFQDEIDEDKQEAQQAGLQGTPHFVVKASGSDTGTPVRGAQPFSQFQQEIDSLLN